MNSFELWTQINIWWTKQKGQKWPMRFRLTAPFFLKVLVELRKERPDLFSSLIEDRNNCLANGGSRNHILASLEDFLAGLILEITQAEERGGNVHVDPLEDSSSLIQVVSDQDYKVKFKVSDITEGEAEFFLETLKEDLVFLKNPPLVCD